MCTAIILFSAAAITAAVVRIYKTRLRRAALAMLLRAIPKPRRPRLRRGRLALTGAGARS